ncbi:MAG: hypothetical protein RR842_12625 [Gordonibacter sp.]|uniref:hypothetical protein n=1 Tax=Eggerthellaceae TaxID=1643826 RepID=UPI0022E80050|nr:hypothetical protein [Eggerthella lenta]
MASDFGDESGEKLFDWMLDVGERAGAQAMEDAASKLVSALRKARGDAGLGDDEAKWARLDMAEFKEIEDYATIREIIDAQLDKAGVAHELSMQGDKELLVFKVEDTPKVDKVFADMIEGAKGALGRAKVARSEFREKQKGRDEQPLDERSQQAREASAAHEQSRGGFRQRAKELAAFEVKSK